MLRWGPAAVIVGLFLTGALIFGFTVTASNKYLSRDEKKADSTACFKTGATYTARIQNNRVEPSHIDAKRCDILAVNNYDNVSREIAFGDHDHHTVYNGVYETFLKQNQGFKVILSQSGTFRFHDHFDDAVTGSFTVLP